MTRGVQNPHARARENIDRVRSRGVFVQTSRRVQYNILVRE